MKTRIVLEITHDFPIDALAERVASRAWEVSGVTLCKAVAGDETPVSEMVRQGFTLAELSLGSGEVFRG